MSCAPSRKLTNTGESSVRRSVASNALSLIGSKYKYGGKTPKGFDCSGFTAYVYGLSSFKLNASSQLQARQGSQTSLSEARQGDLLFFRRNGRINHVAIIIENDQNRLEVVHATTSKGVIREDILHSTYWNPKIAFARTVFN